MRLRLYFACFFCEAVSFSEGMRDDSIVTSVRGVVLFEHIAPYQQSSQNAAHFSYAICCDEALFACLLLLDEEYCCLQRAMAHLVLLQLLLQLLQVSLPHAVGPSSSRCSNSHHQRLTFSLCIFLFLLFIFAFVFYPFTYFSRNSESR